MARQKKGRPILPGVDVNANSVMGGFARPLLSFKVRPVQASGLLRKETNIHLRIGDTTMNVETLEMNAVTDAAKADDTFELLALSLDDLDLIGGGIVIGNIL
jgi:hypothetical protein